MTYISKSIQRIRSYLSAPGVTKKALALEAGIAPNVLRNVWSDEWHPRANTLVALERAIDAIPADELAAMRGRSEPAPQEDTAA